MEGNRLPPPLTALFLPVLPHLPLFTCHATLLRCQSHPWVPTTATASPTWTPPSPTPRTGAQPFLPSLGLQQPGSQWPLGSAFSYRLPWGRPTGVWVFCSNLRPEFRSGLQPGFCLGPRWEFGPCSLDDFKAHSKSDFVLSPCLSLRRAPYSAACARRRLHFSHRRSGT